MPKTSATSSESDSSPEKKIISTSEIMGREGLRSSGRFAQNNSPTLKNYKLYPELPTDPLNRSAKNPSPKNRSQSPASPDSSQEDFSEDYQKPETSYTSPKTFRSKTPAPKPDNSRLWIVAGIIVLIIACIAVSKKPAIVPSEEKLNCTEFFDLMKKYPRQDKKLFKTLKAGAESVLVPGTPSVFSFFSTDETLLTDLTGKIVEITKKCIRQSNDPLILTKDNVNEKVVEKYRDELSKSSIMLVNNVDNFASHDVSNLHSFCDTYNPVVPNSIIFLTIKVPQAPTGKPIEYITQYLQSRWSDLDTNIRDPLITRFLDNTFFFKP